MILNHAVEQQAQTHDIGVHRLYGELPVVGGGRDPGGVNDVLEVADVLGERLANVVLD